MGGARKQSILSLFTEINSLAISISSVSRSFRFSALGAIYSLGGMNQEGGGGIEEDGGGAFSYVLLYGDGGVVEKWPNVRFH